MSQAVFASACHCGSGDVFPQCCGRFVGGSQVPATAEQLMRSRYSAYVLRDETYLAASWHPETRPSAPVTDASQRWLGLRILRTEAGQPGDGRGIVEFVARYKIDGRAFRLRESSAFTRYAGRWVYVEALPESTP